MMMIVMSVNHFVHFNNKQPKQIYYSTAIPAKQTSFFVQQGDGPGLSQTW